MDTAQPIAAAETDPNVQLENAADAFKAFEQPQDQPRDPQGKFAPKEQPEEQEEIAESEYEADEADYEDEADEDGDEAADEAQPMPPSWPADKADQWAQLPAETQQFIAEREAERERAINAKFQESANVRKEYEAKRAEALAKVEEFSRAVETVTSIYRTPEPDARAFGYGTHQYNEAAYLAAHQEWRQTEGVIAQLEQQRNAAREEATKAEQAAMAEWKQQHESEFAPKLLTDVPELKDPVKGQTALGEMFRYAVESGIPEEIFAPENQGDLTSAQLHILWKAQQFDRLRAKKTPPKARPSGPAVKPGVSSPRSAKKAAQRNKAFERLDREGSIEAGAAMFKHLF